MAAILRLVVFNFLHLHTNKTGPTTSKEWTTPDCRNTPSTTNLEEEGIVDDQGNDGNVSMPEQVKRPNLWRKMMMTFLNSHYSASIILMPDVHLRQLRIGFPKKLVSLKCKLPH